MIRVSVDAGNVGEQSYRLKISKSLNKKKNKKINTREVFFMIIYDNFHYCFYSYTKIGI